MDVKLWMETCMYAYKYAIFLDDDKYAMINKKLVYSAACFSIHLFLLGKNENFVWRERSLTR